MANKYLSNLFFNESKSDMKLVIEGKRIPVDSSILSNESNYFAAMFRVNWIESRATEIFIETKFRPFILVLMLAYRCVIKEDVWALKSITDIIESMIIANRFLFSDQVMEALSEKYFKKLQLLETNPKDMKYRKLVFHNLSLISETYKLANYYNLDHLILKCEHHFNEYPNHTLQYFEKHSDYSIILLEKILKRDTFGVQEISIYHFINKLITKFGVKPVMPLFTTIRFDLMSFEDFSMIITNGIFDGKTDYSLSEIIDTTRESNSRICFEVNKNFETESLCRLSSRTNRRPFHRFSSCRRRTDYRDPEPNFEVICSIINLPIETRINYLSLQINKLSEFDSTTNLEFVQLLKIELFSRNGIKTGFDYHILPKVGQKIYFSSRLVSQVCIHCDYRLFIASVSYGFNRKAINQFTFHRMP